MKGNWIWMVIWILGGCNIACGGAIETPTEKIVEVKPQAADAGAKNCDFDYYVDPPEGGCR